MIGAETIVARRYAKSFVNLFASKMNSEDLEKIRNVVDYMKEHKHMLFFFNIATIDDSIKKKQLLLLLERFAVRTLLDPLADTLLADKRVFLLPLILHEIIQAYKEYARIRIFTITSSHALSSSALDTIKNFLARLTGCAIIYTYHIDKKLIAGIRLADETGLWEYSIARQLKQVRQRSIH